MLKPFRFLKNQGPALRHIPSGPALRLPSAAFALLLLLSASSVHAQTKVFKAVAQDMAQEFETIVQDNKLVGYLMFTQLEKASADSFNYKLSIMDENLNDIGSVNFREQKLNLKSVSFEQDVLCLAYVQSNFVGKEFRNAKEFHRESDNAKANLFTQFINLDGKIIATGRIKMEVQPESQGVYYSNRKVVGNGHLKQSIQLKNIPGKGFACFYGDDLKNNLVIFNTAGKQTWQKQINEDATDFTMLTSGPEVNLLIKLRDEMLEGGYEVLSYNPSDGTVYPKFLLKDKKGNSLKPLTFDNDPVTGKPFVSGMVIDPVHGNHYGAGKDIWHRPYCGFFSISLNGHTKKDIKASFSYYADGSQSFIDKDGYYTDAHVYANVEHSFRDYQGNTLFAAAGIKRKVAVGAIVGAVLTLPTVFFPPIILGNGLHRYSTADVMLIKQDSAGKLSMVNSIPAVPSPNVMPGIPFSMYGPGYYTVSNSDTRTEYLVVSDYKDINIYNINQKKIARTIPHKEGNNMINVFPAKEGYVMVFERDLKEGTARLSIESL
jgi:hypothetical protein